MYRDIELTFHMDFLLTGTMLIKFMLNGRNNQMSIGMTTAAE